MNWRGKDNVPRRIHLQKEADGIVPNLAAQKELESYGGDNPPELAADVWATYLELDARRQYSAELGPLRFSWLDLYAYEAMTGSRLGRWHLKTIFAVEDCYFTVRAENQEKKKG